MYLNKIMGLSVLVFLTVSFVACESKKDTTAQVKEVRKVDVDIHTLQRQTYPIWIDFSGKTEAFQDVEVVSRVSGELQKIYFKAGDAVQKNQILFKIDDSEYKAILEQKKATLLKDKASLGLAQATLNRYAPLVKKDLVPREKLDELKANVEQLQAVVDADKAVVRQAQLNVEHTKVKASVDGLVGKESISRGNLVSANSTSLTRIVNANTLYVNFSPSANTVSLIKKYRSQINPKVLIKLDSSTDVELHGKIDFIDNFANETTGTVNMRAIIENEDNIILPGTFVEIQLLLTDKISILGIHPDNIGQNQLGSFVYVVNANNKIETKQIKLKYSNTSLAIVESGLQEGDKMIVSNITRLRNNLLVNAKTVENPIKK
ncbi:MAG: RND family efflux transporter MFP subunit [Sulfurimonas sp.]|jgi:RND family efflux transporter MFP subunit|uniref:efflux RND transporter periplasmic adaptor subunit n=1 Tax=Sulfurimonas sp. TaxID=2022749 RepID=UPI0039E6E8B2